MIVFMFWKNRFKVVICHCYYKIKQRRKMLTRMLSNKIPKHFHNTLRRALTYVQGQEPEPKIREYFYYVDHQGMLFLDDAKMKNFTSCFKEKKFLKFFFSRLKYNDTERYRQDFPFLSLCGRERNFLRCDDTPIVFTHLLKDQNGSDRLAYAHGGDVLSVDFRPDCIYMNPVTGRVYHPAWEKVGGIGLIRSKLAIEMSRDFIFEKGEQQPPTHFMWQGERLVLQTDWVGQTKRHGMFESIMENCDNL